MDKSPDAFRTISEVAEVLETPAHVLRFWESRFPQIRPVKRAGGRRYYRPADVALLLGIKHLLHNEGMTIRGVQKVLREQGVRHVAALSGQEVSEEGDNAEAALEAALAANFGALTEETPLPQDQIETAQIVALEDALRARTVEVERVEGAAPADVLPLFDHVATIASKAIATEESVVEKTIAAPCVALAPAEPAPEAPMLEDATPEDIGDTFAAAPSPVASLSPPAQTAPLPADAPLLARLRALPAGALALAEARALRDQLAALAVRMASAPQTPL